jgi:hypothetical protein
MDLSLNYPLRDGGVKYFQRGIVGSLTDYIVKCGRGWICGNQQDGGSGSAKGDTQNA